MISVWYPASRTVPLAPYLLPLTAGVYAEGAAIAAQQPAGPVAERHGPSSTSSVELTIGSAV